MIDAGSSGSRIHVYRFNYCREEPELEDEVFYPIEPGLSSYKDDPEAAAASLDELMQIALDNVPAELQHCTPLAVKATAGLRLLGEDESANILNAVRTRLETNYPFPLAGVEIMDGKDEGNGLSFFLACLVVPTDLIDRCLCVDYGKLSAG